MPKKKKVGSTLIQDMIVSEKEGRKKEILLELQKLNKEAYRIMHSHSRRWGNKYQILQKTEVWKKAKKLLLEYFTFDSILRCEVCGDVIDSRRSVLHHKEYSFFDCFTPRLVIFIHEKCHKKIHEK